MYIIKASRLPNLGLRIYCLGKEVLPLFPQRMRTCGLLPDWYGLMEQEPPESCCEHPPKLLHPSISRKQFPNTAYKCLFTFKRGYDIDMNNLHWYKSWFIEANLRPILLYICIYYLD